MMSHTDPFVRSFHVPWARSNEQQRLLLNLLKAKCCQLCHGVTQDGWAAQNPSEKREKRASLDLQFSCLAAVVLAWQRGTAGFVSRVILFHIHFFNRARLVPEINILQICNRICCIL